ncbi:unnamed protein product [Lota lota]
MVSSTVCVRQQGAGGTHQGTEGGRRTQTKHEQRGPARRDEQSDSTKLTHDSADCRGSGREAASSRDRAAHARRERRREDRTPSREDAEDMTADVNAARRTQSESGKTKKEAGKTREEETNVRTEEEDRRSAPVSPTAAPETRTVGEIYLTRRTIRGASPWTSLLTISNTTVELVYITLNTAELPSTIIPTFMFISSQS